MTFSSFLISMSYEKTYIKSSIHTQLAHILESRWTLFISKQKRVSQIKFIYVYWTSIVYLEIKPKGFLFSEQLHICVERQWQYGMFIIQRMVKYNLC